LYVAGEARDTLHFLDGTVVWSSGRNVETLEQVLYSRIFDGVISGMELWKSMKRENDFSDLDCSVVRIGEETGRLADALAFLVDYYNRKNEQKRMLVGALSYPSVTLCIAVIVLIFMLTVVVPMFEQVYNRMGGELPGITKHIIDFSQRVPSCLVALSIISVTLCLVRHYYGNTTLYQKTVSQIIAVIPGIGKVVKMYQVSRLCRIWHLLLSSDVPILESLRLMKGIISFYPYRESIEAICRAVEKGASLAEGISPYVHLYGKRFIVLLKVGEETNSLDNILLSQANDTYAELDYEIKQLNSLAEPFIIVCIGVIVAFVLIAMYMPMFKLGMTIQ